MRDITANLAVFLALLGFLTSESRPESIGKPAAGRIAQLINQLGSKKFQERELAARELDAAGAVALESLKTAGRHPDPEISRRAECLAQRIEKRIETAQIVEAKCVHLSFRDTPLDEAVAEFARKTGFTIDLQSRPRDQRITLDTGETTFWQALDQFCKKAGLVEQTTTHANPAAEQAVRVLN